MPLVIRSNDLLAELASSLDSIAQRLRHEYQKDNLPKVLKDAIDVILYVSYPSKELIGFNIDITTGGPNISLVYDRGVCELRGAWGGVTATKHVDNEICEMILDFLSS